MPWKIEESNEPSGLDGIWLSGLAGLKELFLGFKDELTEEEWSDIRLIAAAPDLLAACEMALELMPGDTRFPPRKYVDCKSALKSAISKARATT